MAFHPTVRPDPPNTERRMSARLQTLTTLFDAGSITARVGSILPLSEARQAQAMLAGAPHKSGKIVLRIGHTQQNRSAQQSL